MVKHVVMWRYADKKSIEIARKQLEGMRGRVPALLSIQTGVNFLESPASYDLVLITEHKDRAALDAQRLEAEDLPGRGLYTDTNSEGVPYFGDVPPVSD